MCDVIALYIPPDENIRASCYAIMDVIVTMAPVNICTLHPVNEHGTQLSPGVSNPG